VDPVNELRTDLANALADHMSIPLRVVEEAVNAVTADWAIRRQDYPHSGQHPMESDDHGHRLVATLPFVPETDDERTHREAGEAARLWAFCAQGADWDDWDAGEEIGPPPQRVGAALLLDQCHWWRGRERTADGGFSEHTVPMRLADMTHDHRMALLEWLRQRAPRFKLRADWVMAGSPPPFGDMACDAFEAACDDQFATPDDEWIERQPLVRALVRWTTPYAESPLTWRPIAEAPRRFDTLIIGRWSDLTDHDDMPIMWSGEDGWAPADAAGYGGFDDDPDQWRELRDDEYCPHDIPNIVSEVTQYRIASCRWCDHGHDPGEDENCDKCREELERMDF